MSTRSNDTSSTSDKPSSKVPKTWELLQESREELVRLREFHRSSLWDSFKVLLQAERLFHLEQLAETNDETEARDHRFIARWIKHFMETVPERVEGLYQSAEAESRGDNPRPDPDSGGSPYMESDRGDEPEEDVA